MQKYYRVLSLAALITLALAGNSAHASIAVVGVLNDGTLGGSGETDSLSGKAAFGAGILIDHPISIGTSLEFGAIYQGRKYDDTTSGFTISSNQIQIPVLIRFNLIPMLSIGAGGYWETGSGDITATSDSNGSTTTFTYSALGVKQSDFGLIGSVRLHFPMGPGMHFLVDGRYNYGLTNTSTAANTTVTMKGYQVLAGFSFGFGGI